MITNREISSRALLEDALDELVESAGENGVPEEEVAEALRTRAADVGGDPAPTDAGAGEDAQR